MAICDSCDQEMTTAKECTFNAIRFPDGKWMLRSSEHFDEKSGRCHDCNVIHGRIHHYGCDVERCPMCGDQLISCDCLGESGEFAVSKLAHRTPQFLNCHVVLLTMRDKYRKNWAETSENLHALHGFIYGCFKLPDFMQGNEEIIRSESGIPDNAKRRQRCKVTYPNFRHMED